MTSTISINAARLEERLSAISRFGATPAGGLDRQALTPAEIAARGYVLGVARERGFDCATDAIGNLFVRRTGERADLLPIVSGSHLDSQPQGGRFDGTLGVMAALEMLESLEDADVSHDHPIEMVAWMNEEGGRFVPGTMGSQVFAGVADLADMLAVTDEAGESVAESLAAANESYGPLPERTLGGVLAGYLELHIEQGPILESRRLPLGVVDGIQGARWRRVVLDGRPGHAGTTPEALRHDAGDAAIRAATAARAAVHADGDDRVRFTIGRIEFSPGTVNTIPGSAHFTIDLRHPDDATLDDLERCISEAVASVAAPCSARIESLLDIPALRFDARIVAACEASVQAQGLPVFQLTSGAFHDAQFAARCGPAGMLFIPCREGISHSELEAIEPGHAAIGTQTLLDTVLTLDRSL